MTDKSVVLIIEKLELLAQSIGIGAKELFPYFIRQQYIEAIQGGIILILGAIYFGSLNRWVKKIKKYADKNNCDDLWGGVIVAVILITALFIFLICSAFNNIFAIFNPTCYAVQDILSMLNPK